MQGENYLEESVTMTDEARSGGKTKYVMANVVSYVSVVIAAISIIIVLISQFSLWLFLIPTAACIAVFVIFRMRRDRYVFECDYIFVDGSLRIAKVLNGRSRKALCIIDCTTIVQAGKIESEGYKRYSTMKDLKPVMATPNVGYLDDEIFYLFYEDNGQRKLVLIQPSNMLMLAISKAAKKNIFV